MSYDLADLLAASRADLREPLCGPAAWEALERLSHAAPDGASQFGFECRLAAGEDAVDLGLAVAAGDPAAARLAGHPATARDVVPTSPAWRHLRAFAAAWTATGSALGRAIPFLFLELDAASARTPAITPSVFVALDPPLLPAGGAPGGSPVASGPGSPLSTVLEATSLLRGQPPSPRLRRRIAGCFEALPEDAHVIHLGVLLGRKGAGVRLSIAVAEHALPPLLDGVGWHHAHAELERCVRRYERCFQTVQVDLDVDSEGVRPRLGLGLRPVDRAGWKALLASFVADGLADPDKATAVLGWPGQRVQRIEGYGLPCLLTRDTSHAKVAVTPGRPARAKAYLSVAPRIGWFGA